MRKHLQKILVVVAMGVVLSLLRRLEAIAHAHAEVHVVGDVRKGDLGGQRGPHCVRLVREAGTAANRAVVVGDAGRSAGRYTKHDVSIKPGGEVHERRHITFEL